MKTLLVILLFPAVALCQGFLPRWEMSLSGDVNNISATQSYVSFAFRPGFYPILGEGLSIEPELAYGRANGINAFNISGNVSYSLEMGYWPFVPFVLVGYGVGDGIPFSDPLARSDVSGSTDISLLNIGAGVKVMALGGRALFRLEYRYQGYSASTPISGAFGYPDHVFGRRVLLGFAVLL
jgi:hypothetical protein